MGSNTDEEIGKKESEDESEEYQESLKERGVYVGKDSKSRRPTNYRAVGQ